MKQEFINHLKRIDNLQGLVYQNLMEAFNDLTNVVKSDFDDISNIGNVQQLKHLILSRLKNSTAYINSPKFRVACITCSAVRILGLLKYELSSKYLSEDDHVQALGQIITDYKIDKKYTEQFYNTIIELKGNISKFISNKQLRKQFHLDDFCIQLLSKEMKAIEESFPEGNEINPPAWIKELNKEDLNALTQKAIEILENEDYDGFLKLIR